MPVIVVHLVDRHPGEQATGVVHQDVEPPEVRDQVGDGLVDAATIGDVKRHGDRLTAA